MSEVTIEAIGNLLETKLQEHLEPIKIEIAAIKETVSGHTGAIVEIAKDVKDLKEQMLLVNRRFDKNEKAIKFTAEKVGVKEEVEKIIQS